MDELDLRTVGTGAQQIFFLQAAAATCRRLAGATKEEDIADALNAMANEYDAARVALALLQQPRDDEAV